VVAVFDFDYPEVESFYTSLVGTLMLCPCSWPSAVCCYPCFFSQQISWEARAQHVALTVDGIKYVRDKRKTLCGLQCSDAGKVSKTVPFDKLTDCDVSEPAGNALVCCVPNVLHTVNVDTASSGQTTDGIPHHELSLTGLSRPHELKKAVWAMKRGHAPANLDPASRADAERKLAAAARHAQSAPVLSGAMERGGLGGGDAIPLLQEIRDELKILNKNFKK
jgi:hypothetical protein